MIVSIFPYGSWQVTLTLPYPDPNEVTPLHPVTLFVFGGISGEVMNIDRWPEM
jgi:hypothetical protein